MSQKSRTIEMLFRKNHLEQRSSPQLEGNEVMFII